MALQKRKSPKCNLRPKLVGGRLFDFFPLGSFFFLESFLSFFNFFFSMLHSLLVELLASLLSDRIVVEDRVSLVDDYRAGNHVMDGLFVRREYGTNVGDENY